MNGLSGSEGIETQMKRMHGRWIPATLLALMLLLIAAMATAEEAENLTDSCTVKVSAATKGGPQSITDGSYMSYWESKKGKNAWVTIESPRPLYGLYLCFERMPESYTIQKGSGEAWTDLAEGDTRFHHIYYPLDGENRIRILADKGDKKSTYMGFNEVFVFGEGEVPDWVQRWNPPAEKADILFLATHPDDELLFMGGALATYAAQKQLQVEVAYLTYSNTTRRSEALNGLWTLGIRNYPVFLGVRDVWSNNLTEAYKKVDGGKNALYGLVTELFRRFKPDVVVTQDLDGEYGHTQHKMVAKAAVDCCELAADSGQYPESAAEYGTWEVRKLYLHLYGDETNQTRFNWDEPQDFLGGKTANELAEEAYAKHETQKGKGQKINGVKYEFSVETYGGKLYPSTCFGLYFSKVGDDVNHDDFLENLPTAIQDWNASGEPASTEKKKGSGEAPEEDAEDEETDISEVIEETEEAAIPEEETEETSDEGTDGEQEETENQEEPEEAVDTEETESTDEPEGNKQENDMTAVSPAPEWADVLLNERGYLDEGSYVLEDADNGHWMYVDQTLRIQIVRSWETPEKAKKSDKAQSFFCFTAEIWCDIENGEFPMNVWADPDNKGKNPKLIEEIATDNKLIYAVSADYYQYRVGQKSAKKSYKVGIEIRDGEIRWDDPNPKPPGMPTYETLAIFADGHVESAPSTDRGAEDYLKNGAVHVYTFGPSLVKDGEISPIIAEANRVLNPRHAFGMVEPGHYIDVICEGRLKSVDGSTGVMMETLAQIMLERGCQVAVNLDGGDTAVCAFMGKKLNLVVDPQTMKQNHGRTQVEALGFGVLKDAE